MTGRTLRLGVALDLAAGPGQTYADRLDELGPVLDLAVEAGYHGLSAGESYVFSGSDAMGFHSPNALMMLAALAPRLPGMRLIAGVSLLAGWDARRLAYDSALVDQLSGGRLTLGLGLGSPAAWRVFGIAPQALGQRLESTVRLLRDAWSGSYSLPEGRVDLVPGPVQAGGPPLLLGGARKVSAERAGALADGFVASSGYSRDLITRQVRSYRAACRPGAPGTVSVNRFTVVAATEREALARYREHVEPLLAAYRATGLADVNGGDIDRDGLCLVGTPSRVAELIAEYHELGVTDLQLRVRPGSLPVAAAMESLALVAAAVRSGGPDGGGTA